MAYSLSFFKEFYIKTLSLVLLLTFNLIASDEYSLRGLYGSATDKDLREIVTGDLESHPENLTVLSVDGGYLLHKGMFDLPVDLYVKAGLSRFSEDSFVNIYEVVVYIKAYYNIDFLDNRLRVGLGEGGSFTSRILRAEALEALDRKSSHTSKFLNYLDLSVDVDLGKLTKYDMLKSVYLGFAIKHRSGIFGLVNGVSGGSNYNSLYIEKNF